MPHAIERSTESRSPRVQASEICRWSAELAPNSKRNWKKPKPHANLYAPNRSCPIASTTRRGVHKARSACKGTRNASQSVPVNNLPRIGGNAVLAGDVTAAETALPKESFLVVITPFVL